MKDERMSKRGGLFKSMSKGLQACALYRYKDKYKAELAKDHREPERMVAISASDLT